MERERVKSNDKEIFARTANRAKAVNLYRTQSRGGIRF